MRKPNKIQQQEVASSVTLHSPRPKRHIGTPAPAQAKLAIGAAAVKKFNIKKRDEDDDDDEDDYNETKRDSLSSISAIVSPTSSASTAGLVPPTQANGAPVSLIKKTKRGVMSSSSKLLNTNTPESRMTSTVKQSSRIRDTIVKSNADMPPPQPDLFSDISSVNNEANTVVDSPIIINNKKVLKQTTTTTTTTTVTNTAKPGVESSAEAEAVPSSHQHRYNHLTPRMQHVVGDIVNHQKIIANVQYQKEAAINKLKTSSGSEEYKSDMDIIENILSQSSTQQPESHKTNTVNDALAASSKPISSSKSSFNQIDHDDKENMATNAVDNDDFIPPPPPTKKSKSSIKITKLNKANADQEPTSTQVAKENETPTVETQPAATRSSKRKLPSAKSVDYKEMSPERPVKQKASSSRKESVEATKNKKRKAEDGDEEGEEEASGGGKVVKEAAVLNLYADDDEETKSIKNGNDNDEAEANVVEEATKPATKRITRQKNAQNSNKQLDNAEAESAPADAYEFTSAKARKQPAKRAPPKNKKLTDKQMREKRIMELHEKEMKALAKEHAEIRDYPLIVENVDHDY